MLTVFLGLLTLYSANAAESVGKDQEPIPYFERYKPTFFLMGKPNTKVQVSFKVPVFRKFPLYFGYTQLMMWDLFKYSSPFRDLNFNPEIFYRLQLSGLPNLGRNLDFGILEHESNGKGDPDSRSWNRVYLRYTSGQLLPERGLWWSLKVAAPYGMHDSPSRELPSRRGIWEVQIGLADLLHEIFEVSEVVLRIYGGGASHVNPLQGGQELTIREKETRRAFLFPLYVQIFHGYGENLLDADENRWSFRAGIGF